MVRGGTVTDDTATTEMFQYILPSADTIQKMEEPRSRHACLISDAVAAVLSH